MLNLDDTLKSSLFYTIQRDFYLKAFLYSIGVIIFIEIARNQVSEINLLQLIPGFYLILLFIFLIILTLVSDVFTRFALELDNRKEIGTKTINRLQLPILLKLSFCFGIIAIYLALNNIAPLSLDSFNSYGEKTLENIWSFDELLNLEIALLVLLIILLQFPLLGLFSFSTEIDVSSLPQFWKITSFGAFLISGLITPTIDGYTQISFALLSISIFVTIIALIEKRLTAKFISVTTLN